MKILIYGKNAVSCLYGWALFRAGHHVEFLIVPSELELVDAKIEYEILDARIDPRGRFEEGDFLAACRTDLPTDHDFDLVIVAVRHDQLAEAAASLGFKTANATVLVFGNLWAEPLQAIGPIPTDRLAWGFPSAGGSFDANGVLQGALLRNVHFGTLGSEVTHRELTVRRLFSDVGFKTIEQADFRGWLWLHFAVAAGMNAQALKAGSNADLIASPVHLKSAILTVRELIPVVAARGVVLGRFSSEIAPYRFPAWLGGWILQNSIRSNDPVRLVMELQDDEEDQKQICREVLAEARKQGISVPRLAEAESLFT